MKNQVQRVLHSLMRMISPKAMPMGKKMNPVLQLQGN